MRLRLPARVLLAALAVTVGCSTDSTEPNAQPSALAAAQELSHLADSLAANGGEPSEIGAFRGLAGLVMNDGRISTVTISVDGVPTEFLAAARQVELAGCSIDQPCAMIGSAPLRSFVAWQKSDPRRVVQLTSVRDFAIAGSWSGLDAANASNGSTLLYLDGSGQLFTGISGTQSIAVTTSDTPCVTNDVRRLTIYAQLHCTQAEFVVAFNGVVTRSTFAQRDDVSTGSHTLSMSSRAVHGARIIVPPMPCVGCSDGGVPPSVVSPPISRPPGDSLTASLRATVGSDVTLSFTVTNTTGKPATIQFPNAQQYDLRIWNDAGGALVWRWAADKAFAQVLTSRTLAAGESATYVEHWTSASKGSYRALAYLTSSSHGAATYASFVVP